MSVQQASNERPLEYVFTVDVEIDVVVTGMALMVESMRGSKKQ